MPWWVIVGVIACGGTPSAPPADDGEAGAGAAEGATDPLAEAHAAALAVAERVGREVDCASATARYLCMLPRLSTPAELPEGHETWLGVNLAVRPSRALVDGALETLRLSQITFHEGQVFVGTLVPSTPSESIALGTLRLEAAKAAAGTADSLEVPQSMADWLALPPETTWPLTRDEQGWAFQGANPSRLYQVDAADPLPAAWVTVEQTQGGAFVSVFPQVAWGPP